MAQNNVHPLESHVSRIVNDPLTEILRSKAREMIALAVEIEAQSFVEAFMHLRLEDGRQRVVRNGYLPEREVMTGIGSVPVQGVRVRDRGARGTDVVEFHSSILPPYLRKSKSIEALLPWLYLKGISTGDFQEALQALLGPNAAGLSASTISRLKTIWEQEYDEWRRRRFDALGEGKEYVYWWVDGIHCCVRSEEEKQCLLRRSKIAFSSSAPRRTARRNSLQSWTDTVNRRPLGASCSWTSRSAAWWLRPSSP